MSQYCSNVVFSNKAYNAIIRETFSKDPVETGGILLGHIGSEGIWVVMEVIPPGINSIFQVAYFEYDFQFVHYLAQSVGNMYKMPLQVLGLWHRHPGSMDVFSSTDDATNSTFSQLQEEGVISGLVNIDPAFRFTLYHLDKHDIRNGHPRYEEVDFLVGDDIIPESYFELKYVNSVDSDLHPFPPCDPFVDRGHTHKNGNQRNDIDKEKAKDEFPPTNADQDSIVNRSVISPYSVMRHHPFISVILLVSVCWVCFFLFRLFLDSPVKNTKFEPDTHVTHELKGETDNDTVKKRQTIDNKSEAKNEGNTSKKDTTGKSNVKENIK